MISRGQFCVLFLLGRIFILMTYVPLMGEGYSVMTQMAASLISVLILGLAALPLLILSKKNPGESLFHMLSFRFGRLGRWIGGLYVLAALALTVQSSSHFLKFIFRAFFPGGSAILLAGVLLGVCLYASYAGTESVARTASVVIVIFLLMAAVTGLSSIGELEPLRMVSEQGGFGGLFSAILEELSRNSQILLFPFLLHKVKGGPSKGLMAGLVGQLVLLELFSFMMPSVLGLHLRNTEYPFFSLISYIGHGSLGRLDAFYMLVWTLSALVYISIFLSEAGEVLSLELGFSRHCRWVLTGLAYLGTIAVLYGGDRFFAGLTQWTGWASLLILYCFIPLLLWIGGLWYDSKQKNSFSGSGRASLPRSDRVR